jgi:glutamate racemase
MSPREDFVAIFDSGVGGLTVFKEVMQKLPHENLLYFGDMARVPYGGRTPKTILRYAMECISFLMKRRLKCLIVACHTVSAHALEELKEKFDLPIIGVVEPMVQELETKKEIDRLLILGTRATIASNIYPRLILEKNPELKIFSLATPLFVPLVEEGMADHPATELIIKEYLRPLEKEKMGHVLLGCTHYPLMKEALAKVLGKEVKFLDAAPLVATKTYQLLASLNLLSKKKQPSYSFLVTDHREKFCSLASRFLGKSIALEDVEEVSLDS